MEGMYTVHVVNSADFTELATTPLALCNTTERPEGEEVPPFCSQ
jgi:hypothetical protein